MITTGYTTDFWGEIEVTPPLNKAEVEYLNLFADTRRMHRHSGPYTVVDPMLTAPTEPYGQTSSEDIIDGNQPHPGQPGLWCQWIADDDGAFIRWDGNEKFYHAAEWMAYIIDHFLRPDAVTSILKDRGDDRFADFTYDHVLNGTIDAQGEDPEDRWRLKVTDNIVTVLQAKFVFEGEEE